MLSLRSIWPLLGKRVTAKQTPASRPHPMVPPYDPIRAQFESECG